MKLIFVGQYCRFVYSDEAAEITREAGMALTTRRASHVEPTPNGQWNVDLTPVGGPCTLGLYDRREDALEAEHEWLEAHGIPVPKE